MRRLSHLDIDDSSQTSPLLAPSTANLLHRDANTSLRNVSSAGHLPLPGRTRRKRMNGSSSRLKQSFLNRLYAKWCKPLAKFSAKFSNNTRLMLAVALWYTLGVVSIGSSKILLMQHNDHFGSVPPLFLTFQQLLIGSTLLRSLLSIKFMGSAGIQPWPGATASAVSHSSLRYAPSPKKTSPFFALKDFRPHQSLALAAVYFTMGFLATNYGFSGSSAAFVETIKASEPITSASVAVWFGIETLSKREATSLLVIVLGVLLSTVGNYNTHDTEHQGHVQSTLSDSVISSLVVIASNLCFSFRGLHQKLFRATPEGNVAVLDDLNLQFRMQQLGVIVLAIPVLLWDSPSMLRSLWTIIRHVGIVRSGLLWRYLSLALLNGCAFTSYNLASTYILTRISVVHHAALNCIRRIFAIIVTSIFFGVPITFTGVVGIVCSFVGFMAFSHYKVQRMSQPKQLSSLLPVSALHNSSQEA